MLLLATKDTFAHTTRGGRPAIAGGAGLPASVPPHLPPHLLRAEVSVEDVTAEPSWDVSPETMLALTRRVASALLDDGFAGVVVAHGADTVEETAYLTDLLTGSAHGGVVFTTGVRRLDHPSPAGPRNLADSLAAADPPDNQSAWQGWSLIGILWRVMNDPRPLFAGLESILANRGWRGCATGLVRLHDQWSAPK
ncbi:asparaginase domain-containing protein [Sinosporangium siamense]|uniref:L-asparaginase N-terminal domain-containing protein n=1 Tax=Sinosporangium siamense TaxID=1367973 RepID=A0A919VA79_9ACTN|nr:asparaginase domain-containing protein [Sinosporangium siamense]GII96166.1 hypothetical protein Ssi02_63970 [Sinosporangium siamense]